MDLLAAAAGEARPTGRPRCVLESWAEFRRLAAADAQQLVARMQSFIDAIAVGAVPAWILKLAESRARQELGPDQDTWPRAARRMASVGIRAVEALAAWLVAVLQAARSVSPPQGQLRLRNLKSYCSVDVDVLAAAAWNGREISPHLLRLFARLAGFSKDAASALLRNADICGDAAAAGVLLEQPWVPQIGLHSNLLCQLCAATDPSARDVEALAARTEPDGPGFRALWQRSGSPGALGQAIRSSAARWASLLDHNVVAAAVADTPLKVEELADDEGEPSDAGAGLEGLRAALAAEWLDGLVLHGDTARHIYARRPLTAASIAVVQQALRSRNLAEAEAILASVEQPCLVRHDSCGVVALLDWLGRDAPMPAPAGAQLGPSGTAQGGGPARCGNDASAAAPPMRPLLVRLLHGLLQTDSRGEGPRRHPPQHSRASVEAVECLLTACPRLARCTAALEHLGPTTWLGECSASGADSACDGAVGRLTPLQTLCVYCGEVPNASTAALVRSLLRRSPEAVNQPLPRTLRRTQRGRHGREVFVSTADQVLELRCLAAEEAANKSGAAANLAGDSVHVLRGMRDDLLATRKLVTFLHEPALPDGGLRPPAFPKHPTAAAPSAADAKLALLAPSIPLVPLPPCGLGVVAPPLVTLGRPPVPPRVAAASAFSFPAHCPEGGPPPRRSPRTLRCQPLAARGVAAAPPASARGGAAPPAAAAASNGATELALRAGIGLRRSVLDPLEQSREHVRVQAPLRPLPVR
eukprot:TRINITY_DN65581_c0_g1_i1.p1 TRINITY_DN65581_c0_g1~~TRINITY_DN65581_c0_g1_i1.p1  ORF type:complete len:834 (+),score=161.17 TRINITY_DN65581_c0_g1_i1:237-2504(+)